MLLYRYLNQQYGIEALQTGKLKVGRLTELNDPLDCSPHVTSEHAKIRSIIGDVSQEMLRKMSETVGLLCFSKVIDDPVIWSHYADAHRGIVLGFEISEEKIPPTKVEYTEARPTIVIEKLRFMQEELSQVDPSDSDRIAKGYSTKAPSWSYEQEYRSLIDLEKCSLIGLHYFSVFPPRSLRQVILGARCLSSCDDIRRTLAHAVRDGGAARPGYAKEVEILRCKGNPTSFKLDFERFVPKA